MVNFYHLPITGIDDDDNDDRGGDLFLQGWGFLQSHFIIYNIYIIYIK